MRASTSCSQSARGEGQGAKDPAVVDGFEFRIEGKRGVDVLNARRDGVASLLHPPSGLGQHAGEDRQGAKSASSFTTSSARFVSFRASST